MEVIKTHVYQLLVTGGDQGQCGLKFKIQFIILSATDSRILKSNLLANILTLRSFPVSNQSFCERWPIDPFASGWTFQNQKL